MTSMDASSASESVVQVRGIHKVYGGGVEALRDVDLEFSRGALTSLLGPSGCGKTTLLKIIAGLLEPTSGEVLVNGRRVSGPGPERAFVFQDFALMPWATALRNVAFGLELRGTPRRERERIARHYIAEVGLSGFEDRYPHELSGGMRQRVGLARALSVDADVLLLDEPFSAVDEQTRRKFQEDLLELRRREKKTFLFVTHSIEEAVYLSDQIVMLSRRPGRVSRVVVPSIDRSASSDEIRRDPRYVDAVEEIWSVLRDYLDSSTEAEAWAAGHRELTPAGRP
jgi:NitT/TauT family transport system ATP-binding protein